MNNSSDRGKKPFIGSRVTRDHVNTIFGPALPPVQVSGRSETVLFETQDCYGGTISGGEQSPSIEDTVRRNPVTGPVLIEGAEPGDVLCVHIQDIKVAATGVSVLRPKTGFLGSEIRKPLIYTSAIKDDRVTFSGDISVPLNPMVGIVGVVPRHGDIKTDYPGRHGGNMDTLDVTVGSRVFLPVQVTGALLSIGGVKACVGDGESIGVGVEVAAEVTVRVDILPGGRFSWPRVETKDDYITVASASSVDQAAKLAVMEMVRWLEQEKGLDFETAYLITGLSGHLRVSQWSNPLMTARMVLPRSVMNKIQKRTATGTRAIRIDVPEDLIDTEDEIEDLEPAGVDTEPSSESSTETVETAATEDTTNDETDSSEKPSEPAPKKRRYRRRRRPSGARRRAQEESAAAESGGEPTAPVEADSAAAHVPASPVEADSAAADVPVAPQNTGASEDTSAGGEQAAGESEEKPKRRPRPRRSSSRRPRRAAGASKDAKKPTGGTEPASDGAGETQSADSGTANETPAPAPDAPAGDPPSGGDGVVEGGEKPKSAFPRRRRSSSRRPRAPRRRPNASDEGQDGSGSGGGDGAPPTDDES
ncbi:MAG: hypothetical protein HOH43_09650 [Candidatus Latescibacteria bacterium]|nr:hypothetical protein [Candidatus Latescibacterota bacterium]